MCLWNVSIPEEREGYGYKIVRRCWRQGVYVPQYEYFFKDGRGGSSFAKTGVRRPGTVYKLGKVTRSLSGHRARAEDTWEYYRAGIHLYKEKPLMSLEESALLVILYCRYRRAVAECKEFGVVVALEIMPIEEIKPGKERS